MQAREIANSAFWAITKIAILAVTFAAIGSYLTVGAFAKTSGDVRITSIQPAFGPVGTKVVITATGLSKKNNSISIGSTADAITNLQPDGDRLTFTMPATPCPPGQSCIQQVLSPADYKLTITNRAGKSNASQQNWQTYFKVVPELATSENLAYFAFTDLYSSTTGGSLLVVELTDPARIAQARRLLQGKEEHKGIMGTIVKPQPPKGEAGARPYNPPWLFHLGPSSVEFFENAIEVCDATASYVAEHLDEVGGAFLPDNVWCPWGSRLISEYP